MFKIFYFVNQNSRKGLTGLERQRNKSVVSCQYERMKYWLRGGKISRRTERKNGVLSLAMGKTFRRFVLIRPKFYRCRSFVAETYRSDKNWFTS